MEIISSRSVTLAGSVYTSLREVRARFLVKELGDHETKFMRLQLR